MIPTTLAVAPMRRGSPTSHGAVTQSARSQLSQARGNGEKYATVPAENGRVAISAESVPRAQDCAVAWLSGVACRPQTLELVGPCPGIDRRLDTTSQPGRSLNASVHRYTAWHVRVGIAREE